MLRRGPLGTVASGLVFDARSNSIELARECTEKEVTLICAQSFFMEMQMSWLICRIRFCKIICLCMLAKVGLMILGI